jgi:hypothetical protein
VEPALEGHDVSGWTTIPPWLYQNDLPDDELQRVYVAGAERKWQACVADRERLERLLEVATGELPDATTRRARAALRDELRALTSWLAESREAEARAKAFLDQARAAQRRYG